jgi:hypothetical protein
MFTILPFNSYFLFWHQLAQSYMTPHVLAGNSRALPSTSPASVFLERLTFCSSEKSVSLSQNCIVLQVTVCPFLSDVAMMLLLLLPSSASFAADVSC